MQHSEIKTQMERRRQQSKEIGIQTQEASRWADYPKMKEKQNPSQFQEPTLYICYYKLQKVVYLQKTVKLNFY